jgi:hypothetical protein
MMMLCCVEYARPAATVRVFVPLPIRRLVVEVVSYLSPLMPWMP